MLLVVDPMGEGFTLLAQIVVVAMTKDRDRYRRTTRRQSAVENVTLLKHLPTLVSYAS